MNTIAQKFYAETRTIAERVLFINKTRSTIVRVSDEPVRSKSIRLP